MYPLHCINFQKQTNKQKKFTLPVIVVVTLPPTALLLETVQKELHHLQDKLQIVQYQNQLQHEKTDRLLEELATLKNTSMDGKIFTGKKTTYEMGLGRHHNCQSCSMSTLSAHPLKSVVGTLSFVIGLFSDSAA